MKDDYLDLSKPDYLDAPNEHDWPDRRRSTTVRDVVAMLFRRRRLVVISFVSILLGATLAGLLWPEYEAEMKIMVKRERVDPIVSAEDSRPTTVLRPVSAEEVNSEVELLQGDDLLEQVVRKTGLHRNDPPAWRRLIPIPLPSEQEAVAKSVRRIKNSLHVAPVKDTSLITVRYKSSDPERAAGVLKALADAYLQKHLEVHRPQGQVEFFDKQTAEYRDKLRQAEGELSKYSTVVGSASPRLERDMVLQKLNEFEATLEQTNAGISETRNRIAELQRLASSAPERVTTQVRTQNNEQLLQDLQSTLLKLELDRTALLNKYSPTYRPVQELEAKIGQTKQALKEARSNPLRDETTDRDATYGWIQGELAKARSDLRSLQARAKATQNTIVDYRAASQRLNQQDLEQQGLARAAKSAEENYLLYERKREEARITGALDENRIVNVALAESPTVPVLPSKSPFLFAVTGLVLATIVSFGLAFGSEYFDRSFRTPDEVHAYLQVPVLAAIPQAVGAGGVAGHPDMRTGTEG
jgi:uncharacterized protein involved in exopolysaccharide biosynthesis